MNVASSVPCIFTIPLESTLVICCDDQCHTLFAFAMHGEKEKKMKRQALLSLHNLPTAQIEIPVDEQRISMMQAVRTWCPLLLAWEIFKRLLFEEATQPPPNPQFLFHVDQKCARRRLRNVLQRAGLKHNTKALVEHTCHPGGEPACFNVSWVPKNRGIMPPTTQAVPLRIYHVNESAAPGDYVAYDYGTGKPHDCACAQCCKRKKARKR